MAVVIRFNTIIIRKSCVAANYPGGLDAYRALHLPEDASRYYEDQHLVAHVSMGDFSGLEEHLLFVRQQPTPGGRSTDCCDASETEGVNPSCEWLEQRTVGGFPICWLRHSPPEFVSDVKSRRFVRRVSDVTCPSCGITLGMGAAAQAVDQNERRFGPLHTVHENPFMVESLYIVWCQFCGHETAFTDDGRLITN